MSKIIFFLLCLILLVTSCKKNQSVPNLHLDYFGITEGRYVIYDVTEINQDHNQNQNDTLKYQLKTYWADTFVDNEGRMAREFLRYTRNTDTISWSLKDTWTGYIDDNTRGEIVEENQRVVKAVFRPSLDKKWDANAYNQLGFLELSYDKVHAPYNSNGTNFDSTIVIKSDIEPSLIDSASHHYVYAKNIGLIEQSTRSLKYQLNSQGFYLNKGKEIYYRFIETGIE